MNNSSRVMLLGSGADQFAKEEGLEIIFFTLLSL
jgi:isoaspartyl peptidase/L-asparaginase-like protein (Ntn-hydrolase superfamily)